MVAKQEAPSEILGRLFQTPPPEFVAERNRVAKALRAEGDKGLAAKVAAVRRPGVSDWALNVSAAEHADEVGELVEAADEVIDAQEAAMEGCDGGDLRVRLKLLRVCTAAVAALANAIAERTGQTGSGSSIPDVTTRLIEIAANREALRLLERGLLGAEDPGTADPFGVGAESASAPAPRRSTVVSEKLPKGEANPRREATAKISTHDTGQTTAERKQRRAEVVGAKRALAATESAVDASQREVAKHETALARTQERVSDAEARLEALHEAVATATDRLVSVRGRQSAAIADVKAAAAALAAAQRALAE